MSNLLDRCGHISDDDVKVLMAIARRSRPSACALCGSQLSATIEGFSLSLFGEDSGCIEQCRVCVGRMVIARSMNEALHGEHADERTAEVLAAVLGTGSLP